MKNKLYKKLENIGFDYDYRVGEQVCMHNKHKNIGIYIIPPHEGSNMKWIIRMDYISEFDKWGNCYYQKSFNKINDSSIDIIVKDFNKMVKNTIKG